MASGCSVFLRPDDKINLAAQTARKASIVSELSAAEPVATPVDWFIRHLRSEYRIKRDSDFSVAAKYGHVHVMCADIWEETIRRTALEFGVDIVIIGTWSAANG